MPRFDPKNPYAIDNASNTDDPYDTHPCGPGPELHHSFVNDECEDCGAPDLDNT